MTKARLLLLFLLSQTLCSTGTAQSPESFFPHHVGNVWQYRSQFTQQVVSTVRFVADSSSTNGSVFVWYIIQGIGGGIYEIDSSFNVWQVSGDSLTRVRHEYNLAAMVGESWRVNPMPPPFDSARVVDIYPSTVFGQPVTIKKIDYWQRFELGDSLWYGTRYLATGFGLARWDIEPSDVWYLAGAIIDSVQWGVIVDVQENEVLPKTFALWQNFPNPFNPATTITFDLPWQATVRLTVLDILGRVLSVLVDERREAGRHNIHFDATGVASGVLFYRLEASNGESAGFLQTKRMVLVK